MKKSRFLPNIIFHLNESKSSESILIFSSLKLQCHLQPTTFSNLPRINGFVYSCNQSQSSVKFQNVFYWKFISFFLLYSLSLTMQRYYLLLYERLHSIFFANSSARFVTDREFPTPTLVSLTKGSEVTVNNKYSMISIIAVYYTNTKKKTDGILQLREQSSRLFFIDKSFS